MSVFLRIVTFPIFLVAAAVILVIFMGMCASSLWYCLFSHRR